MSSPESMVGKKEKCPFCKASQWIPTSAPAPMPTPTPVPKKKKTIIIGTGVSQKHLKQANEFLFSGESLLAIVAGRVKESSTKTKGRFGFFDTSSDKGGSVLKNYLLVTNQRVILWARGVFTKSTDAFDFCDIKSVESQKGIVFGAIVLNIYGKTENFAEMNKQEALLTADLIRKLIRNSKTQNMPTQNNTSHDSSPVEQLSQLAKLHEQGILTDSEFQSKKTELLSRI